MVNANKTAIGTQYVKYYLSQSYLSTHIIENFDVVQS